MNEKVSSALNKMADSATKNKTYEARRGQRGSNAYVIYKSTKKVKKPQIFSNTIEYNFLQYIRAVIYWAIKDTGLNRGRIELLLYLYPIGLFKRSEFKMFARSVGLDQTVALKDLREKGFIVEWREARAGSKRYAGLFALSSKAKQMCARMHKMCLGEMEVPKIKGVTKDNITNKDKYYLSIIKKMNERRKAAE